jgi:flagellar basal-body rod protein FlgC
VNIFKIFSVSGAGMSAQRSRMSVVSGNLANAETTRTPEGGPYRRRNVFFRAIGLPEESPQVLTPTPPAPSTTSKWLPLKATGAERAHQLDSVEVADIRASQRPPRRVYDPQHPDADSEGYVSYPEINTLEEMTDLLSASRSYEANLATFNTTKALIRKLLEFSRA